MKDEICQDIELSVKQEVLDAEKRIRPYVYETPLEYSRYLSRLGDCSVYLKLENTQRTGSFKFRGAANHILSLAEDEIRRGVITASTGNHGAAFAEMLEIVGHEGTIYLPENAAEGKVDILRSYNVNLKFIGEDCEVAESTARAEALKTGQTFISPYNHPRIIGGQGTVAVELERQLEEIDVVLVPVGGGGLMSGISGYFKSVDARIQCIGCQPEQSPVMYRSVEAGRIVTMESGPTLSDGTAGGIERCSVTFDVCRECVDNFILVSEDEIAQAIRLVLERHYMVIEGAAALSVASFIKAKEQFKGKSVVLVISGKKITLDKLKSVLL
ncbi:MAG: threonine/serine dehydratase [bacterium]|nr:threonine/serine dehydratase [bacterium]